jgi:metal-responsive CopG/Arc/MetJ family transcriptional regulator
MQAIVNLPEAVLRELETLARDEGTTTSDLIQRIVETHVASRQTSAGNSPSLALPLIPETETGPIQAVSGCPLD